MEKCPTVLIGMDNLGYAKPNEYVYKLLRVITLSLFLVIAIQASINAQINFGSFGPYTIQLTKISTDDLKFEGPIISGGGEYEVTLENSFILAIEGVKYLDVGVLITADGELLLEGILDNSGDPQKSISFTLEAAYANKGQNNTTDALIITNTNMGEAIFPILSNKFLPPRPPPPPPTEEFDQSLVEDSAYLYLYGTINVGNVDAGTYSGYINISVQYDNPP